MANHDLVTLGGLKSDWAVSACALCWMRIGSSSANALHPECAQIEGALIGTLATRLEAERPEHCRDPIGAQRPARSARYWQVSSG